MSGQSNPFDFSMTSAIAQALGASSTPTLMGGVSLEAFERFRRRSDWNARFAHWEKPASSTEESTLDRAQRVIKKAISGSVVLGLSGATVEPQGSYQNNTNTRLDSDADLRVQLPLIKAEYHRNVEIECARGVLSLSDSGWTYDQLFTMMRWELESCLGEAFGRENITTGKKAFRVAGITGSRAEVDVVPALIYQNVMWWDWVSRYNTIQGVAILSDNGKWTVNFPDQHQANGISKRVRTGSQFKKVVRIFKKLRGDLSMRGLLKVNIPSFLVESMIYNVEDGFFTVDGDDRYDRVRRIAHRLQQMVRHEATAAAMFEINDLKKLFTAEQIWTWADAIAFADAVVNHLGDA